MSSYYDAIVPVGFADVMRAEIANVRFVIRGSIVSDIGGAERELGVGNAVVCGPTFHWSNVRFSDDALVFGAAITPLGWARMFTVPAVDLADRVVKLADHIPPSARDLIAPIFDAADGPGRVAAADALFTSLVDQTKPVNQDFIERVTAWIGSGDVTELQDLLDVIDLSPRHIERLCRLYFGSPPKRLHRKFRALHSANRLTWQDLTDWRDIATADYVDQSHFIREFKEFNGRTPSEFINGPHILVRQTLHDRLQIDHESPFSLIG